MVNAKQPLTSLSIFAITLFTQIAGHMLLKYYMPNPAIGAVGFILIVSIFSYVLFYREDKFGFILIIYICSHFSYADNQGGLWNLLAFGMVTLSYFFGGWRSEHTRQTNYLILFLLWILILWNILGWILNNPMPLAPRLQGIAAFFGLVLMFHLSSNVMVTRERFRLFLIISLYMIIYQLVVAINQHYALINWNTPLIGNYTELGGFIKKSIINSTGTLGNFELLGEYGSLMICLLVPLLSSSTVQKKVNFKSNLLILMIFISFAFIMLARSRSATVIAILTVIIYYTTFTIRPFSSIDKISNQLKLILVFIIVLPLVGTYLNLDNLTKKFGELSNEKFTVSTIVSGKSINRAELIDLGLKRIESNSWLIGFGYGVPRSNRWAWFGADPEKKKINLEDFHSLYLTLPEIFGWIGALAFLAMVLFTSFRSLLISIQFRKENNWLLALSFGFTVFWLMFLVNEYKITILRNPNYQMLFWIWLGLSNSVIKTIKQIHYRAKKTVYFHPQPG